MHELAALALLTVVAALGCLSMRDLLTRGQSVTVWENVTSSVGVTAFLSAVGFVLERNGIAAVALLLLLTWLVYDTAMRVALAERSRKLCAWLSLALFFIYIGVAQY